MLASLQRLITLSLLAAACGWLLYFGRDSPVVAGAGLAAIAFGHTVFLAAELMLGRWLNRGDAVPPPRWAELGRAWLGEAAAAPQVFFWRQPFRAQAVADQLSPPERLQGRRGVVFIHGFFCNRGFWTPWLTQLQGSGHAFIALNLAPVLGAMEGYAPQIEDAVQRITQATGLAPLLVCHSMGGLAARAWLKQMKAQARVHRVVTLGTPHRGTWLARLGRGCNARQMRLSSDWLLQLAHGMPPEGHARFICWYSNCDNVVFPASSATLPGADNRLLRGVAHVALAFAPPVMAATLALLDEDDSGVYL